jgi:hypothetical protein
MRLVLDVLGAYGGFWTNLWGGFFSCLGYLGIIGTLARHINCSEPGCWRLGHHVGGRVVCRPHRNRNLPDGR